MSDYDELFAPPTATWQRLSPKFLYVRLVAVTITWTIFFAALTTISFLLRNSLGFSALPWVVLGCYLPVLVWRLIRTRTAVARWGYAERDDDVYITHGLLFRSLQCVPYGRMQLVEVSAGPIQRSFGLASVEMVTASSSGSITIPGLERQAAEALRDRFISRGEHLRSGI